MVQYVSLSRLEGGLAKADAAGIRGGTKKIAMQIGALVFDFVWTP